MKWDFVTDKDIQSLLQLTVDTYKESEWSDTDWDIKKIERMLYRAINEPHQFFIKAEQGGKIIGYLLAHYQDYFHNDDLFATKLSGAVRLSNGNTLITESDYGLWEVTPEGNIAWKYEKGEAGNIWRAYHYIYGGEVSQSLGLDED